MCIPLCNRVAIGIAQLRVIDSSHLLNLSFGIVVDNQFQRVYYSANTDSSGVQVFTAGSFH